MARVLKQSKTFYGSTASNLWTWKQLVDEYFETGDGENNYISKNESIIIVTSYLGRNNPGSYFGGVANVNITCNGESRTKSKTFTYPTNVPAYGWVEAQQEEFIVPHNDDGTKTISVKSSLDTTQFNPHWAKTNEESIELLTIPRASSIAVSNYDLGQTIGIIIGKKVDSFVNTISYKIGNEMGVIATKTSQSSLPWEMPLDLINSIKLNNPTNRDVDAQILCDTYSGSQKIGTTQIANFKLYIVDKPIINRVLRTELNDNVKKLTNSVVRSLSINEFTIDATAPLGSEIDQYIIRNGTQNNNSKTNTLQLNDIQSHNNGDDTKTTFTIECIDKRNNKSEPYTLELDFINYINVLIRDTDLIITRTTNASNDAIVSLSGSYYNGMFGSEKNNVTIDCKFRVKGTEQYTTISNLTLTPTSDNTFAINKLKIPFEFDYTKTYEFIFYAQDIIGGMDDADFIFTSSVAIAKWHENGAYIKEIDADVIRVKDKELTPCRTVLKNNIALEGGHSIVLENVERFIDIYFKVFSGSIKYTIDTSVNPNEAFGGGVVMAYDDSSGFDYYVSEARFDRNTATLHHLRTGYFKINDGTYVSRNNNSEYIIIRIETHN